MKKLILTLLLVPGLALASPGGPPRGDHHGPPPLHLMIDKRADELGIAPETVAQIQALAEADRDTFEALRDDVHAAHESLRAVMESDQPDQASALGASADLGAAEQAMRDHGLLMALQIRSYLTPEQWTALQPPPREGDHGRPEGRR